MDNKLKTATFSIIALLVLAPFLQIQVVADSSSDTNHLLREFRADWFNLGNLSSMWDVSIVDGFMTNQIQILESLVKSSNLDRGTTQGLVTTLTIAQAFASDASFPILEVQPRRVDVLLNASDVTLRAFIYEVNALAGRRISQSLAAEFVSSAQNIVQGSTARGSVVGQLVSSADLMLSNELLQEINSANQKVQADIQSLTAAGFTAKVEFDQWQLIFSNPTVALIFVIGTGVAAYLVTQVVADQAAANGHPFSTDGFWLLFGLNWAIIAATTAGTISGIAELGYLQSVLLVGLGISVSYGISVSIFHLYYSLLEFITTYLPWAETTVDNVLSSVGNTVFFDVSPPGSGSISPSGMQLYETGSTVTVTAAPNSAYQFVSWTSNTTLITFTCLFCLSTTATIKGNGIITADFQSTKVPIGLDGETVGDLTDSGSNTVTLATSIEGDVLVVVTGCDSGSATVPSPPTISDTGGNTWYSRAVVSTTDVENNGDTLSEWWTTWNSFGVDIISVTWSDPTCYGPIIAFAVSGANDASPFDPAAGLPVEGAGYTQGTGIFGVSTTNPNDLLIGALMVTNNVPSGDITPPSGLSPLVSTSSGGVAGYVYYEILSSALNSATLTYSFNGASAAEMTLVDAIQAAPASTTSSSSTNGGAHGGGVGDRASHNVVFDSNPRTARLDRLTDLRAEENPNLVSLIVVDVRPVGIQREFYGVFAL